MGELSWRLFRGAHIHALAVIVLTAANIQKYDTREEIINRTGKLLALWALCVVLTLFCTPHGSYIFLYVIDFFTKRSILIQSTSDMESALGRIAVPVQDF